MREFHVKPLTKMLILSLSVEYCKMNVWGDGSLTVMKKHVKQFLSLWDVITTDEFIDQYLI